MFIDSHCHLDFEQFDSDRKAVINRAKQVGVDHFIVPGVGQSNWAKLIGLKQDFAEVAIALGLHPYFINAYRPGHMQELAELAHQQRQSIVAIGEIGLDKTCDHFDKQLALFEQQLALADSLQLPVIIHNRNADGEMIPLLKKFPKLTGVIHAFSGSLQQAKQFVDLGFKLGIGGVITYQRANKTRQTVAQLPIESMLLETDAPDMPLQGEQGQRNEPANINSIFNQLLELRSEDKQTLQGQIFQNTLNLFGLKK